MASAESALIGHTGFVGGNLARQHAFDATFNSTNIGEIAGREFGLLVCGGVYAVKWKANKAPEEDWASIEKLLEPLGRARAERAVLISTIDVYPEVNGVDEETPLDPETLEHHAYGLHRLRVERIFAEQFPDHLVVRLPGLFGDGLKKNVIYDLLNDNVLQMINPASSFQYYCLDHLWRDIQIALDHDMRLINFATEPLPTQTIIDRFFPGKEVGQEPAPEAHYDFRTRHAARYGGENGYIYSLDQVMQDLAGFIERTRNLPS